MKDEEKPGEAGKPQDLKSRTTDFALRVIRLYTSLPKTAEAQILGKQVLLTIHLSSFIFHPSD